MENRCSRCNFDIENGDKFCGNCGIKLAETNGGVALTQVEMKLSDIRLNLGMVYFKKNDFEKACESFKKILDDEPNNAAALKWFKLSQEGLMSVSKQG